MDNRLASERFRVAVELFEAGVSIMRQNLRRAKPEAPREEIEADLMSWLAERPGAQAGDADPAGLET